MVCAINLFFCVVAIRILRQGCLAMDIASSPLHIASSCTLIA
jgi:hypothetical protein